MPPHPASSQPPPDPARQLSLRLENLFLQAALFLRQGQPERLAPLWRRAGGLWARLEGEKLFWSSAEGHAQGARLRAAVDTLRALVEHSAAEAKAGAAAERRRDKARRAYSAGLP